ncbi:MAG: hypothetical protein HC817_12980 [Saprospiraceae bacterium]|nr:hypothetical protein [Saprospiraceae bacterium]
MRGKRMAVRLKAMDLHTNIMNLPKKLLDITRINVYDPDFRMEELKEIPLPPKPRAKKANYAISQAPPQYSDENLAKKTEKSKPFQFLIGSISIENGKFKLDNWIRDDLKPLPKNLLDYRHLDVFDININIHNFMLFKDEFTGVVDGINLRERSGFELNKLVVGDAKISPTETALYGLQIETPYSLVGDTLRFLYPDGYTAFREFDDKVTMDIRLHSGRVLIDDIMTFAVGLENNPFFVRNRQELATVEARVFGKVNTLKLPNFDISLGKGFQAAGKFESRDLKNDNETYVNLDLTKLRTTMPALRQLIPNFKPSEQFDKLGNLKFAGKFFGFLNDFTAKGNLNTDLGDAGMDTKLVIAGDKTTYNGFLTLTDFNLGQFLEDKNLGKVTLKPKY